MLARCNARFVVKTADSPWWRCGPVVIQTNMVFCNRSKPLSQIWRSIIIYNNNNNTDSCHTALLEYCQTFIFFWTIYEEYRLVSGYAKFASKYAKLTVVLVAWCRVIMSRVACQLVSANVALNYKALGFNWLITYLYRFVSCLIACFICTFIRHPGCCYKHGRFTLCHIHSVISGSTSQNVITVKQYTRK